MACSGLSFASTRNYTSRVVDSATFLFSFFLGSVRLSSLFFLLVLLLGWLSFRGSLESSAHTYPLTQSLTLPNQTIHRLFRIASRSIQSFSSQLLIRYSTQIVLAFTYGLHPFSTCFISSKTPSVISFPDIGRSHTLSSIHLCCSHRTSRRNAPQISSCSLRLFGVCCVRAVSDSVRHRSDGDFVVRCPKVGSPLLSCFVSILTAPLTWFVLVSLKPAKPLFKARSIPARRRIILVSAAPISLC